MFNKKYTEVLKILNDEIDLAHGLAVEYNELAKVIKSDSAREEHLRKANEWHYRYVALLDLKTQFKKKDWGLSRPLSLSFYFSLVSLYFVIITIYDSIGIVKYFLHNFVGTKRGHIWLEAIYQTAQNAAVI